MNRFSQLVKFVWRSAVRRSGRTATALLAVAIAAAVATAMLNLYVDVQSKLHGELRRFGANIVVTAKEGKALPPDARARVDNLLRGAGLAVPYGFAIAQTSAGDPIVVAGTDFDRVRRVNSWWSTSSWPSASQAALIGARAAAAVAPEGRPFVLVFNGRRARLLPTGILHTGGAEESRVYLSLKDFTSWTGLPPSTIEISHTGTAAEGAALLRQLGSEFPQAEVRPVVQIRDAEARVFGKSKTAMLASVVLIVLISFLCVLGTLISSVLDRRRDFAVLKALGATQRMVSAVFAAESMALAVAGSVIGYVIGVALAMLIGQMNFHAPVVPRLEVFPVILAGTVAMTLCSALVPIAMLHRVEPAAILKGE